MTAGNRALALIGAMLAGCTAAPGPKPPQVNLGGYSETFRQGYAEGCESAGSRIQRRNEARYKTEADYVMGWNDGFSVCKRR